MKQDIRVAYSEKSKYESSVSEGLHILREQQKHYIYEAYKAMKKSLHGRLLYCQYIQKVDLGKYP